MSKTIFITGAFSGLGKTTAQYFAARGWNVIASMALNSTNAEQIKEAAKRATTEHSIDVLFNIAGNNMPGTPEAYTDEQIVRQIDTNLLGVIRTTKAFLPHFQEKKNGLIISTTSVAGLPTYPLGAIYHATRLALEGWSESMCHGLAMHNIGIKTVTSGAITSDFTRHPTTSPTAYDPLLKKLMDTFQDPGTPLQYTSPESIAEVIYDAATDGRNQLRYSPSGSTTSVSATLPI